MTVLLGERAAAAPRVNPSRGFAIGTLVGFLLWLTADLMLYAVSDVGTLTTALAAPFVQLVPGAFAGVVIALVLGHERRASKRTPTSTHGVVASYPR